MQVNIPRRAFLVGSAAFAAWPRGLFADAPASLATAWENPDGTATDAVMVRRLPSVFAYILRFSIQILTQKQKNPPAGA